jgi:hypothetical protein
MALTAVALSIASLAYAVPARADQFVEAADGSTIDCVLARGALTRIALIQDGFANVSKMASGYPYNDFEVTHEPVRGDIYVSVPLQYASGRVSFFATSSAGHVYKFACKVEGEEPRKVETGKLAGKAVKHSCVPPEDRRASLREGFPQVPVRRARRGPGKGPAAPRQRETPQGKAGAGHTGRSLVRVAAGPDRSRARGPSEQALRKSGGMLERFRSGPEGMVALLRRVSGNRTVRA